MKANFASRGPKQITPDVATAWIGNYFDASVSNGEKPDDILKSLTIDKTAIDSIFQNGHAVKLRIYLAKTTSGIPLSPDYTLILVGVDANNENILDNDQIWDNCSPCPLDCPTKDF